MKESGKDRLKSTINESTLSTAARSPFPHGEGCDTRIPLFSIQRLSQGGRQRGGGFAAKNEANPASLRSAAPSKGRGSRGRSLLPRKGGAPKGRIRIKCSAVLCKSIYESSIIKQMIWTGWGLVTSSGVTPLQNR